MTFTYKEVNNPTATFFFHKCYPAKVNTSLNIAASKGLSKSIVSSSKH